MVDGLAPPPACSTWLLLCLTVKVTVTVSCLLDRFGSGSLVGVGWGCASAGNGGSDIPKKKINARKITKKSECSPCSLFIIE